MRVKRVPQVSSEKIQYKDSVFVDPKTNEHVQYDFPGSVLRMGYDRDYEFDGHVYPSGMWFGSQNVFVQFGSDMSPLNRQLVFAAGILFTNSFFRVSSAHTQMFDPFNMCSIFRCKSRSCDKICGSVCVCLTVLCWPVYCVFSWCD
jgi:hypothetical protein